MQIISKEQVSNWVLLDYFAQKQVLNDKIVFLERKYTTDFQTFEKEINQASEENFEKWDDYIEWQAYNQFLFEIIVKIEDIKNGYFQLA